MGRFEKWTAGLPRLAVLMALANQALVSGMTFLIGIGVARYMGLAEFGKMAMVLILQMFAQSLQGCFVVAPMMALSGRRANRSSSYFAGVLAFTIGLCVIAGLGVTVMVLGIHYLRDGGLPVALALAAGAFTATQNLVYVVRRMLFARQASTQATLMDAGRYGLFVAAMVYLWSTGARLDVVVTLLALAATGLLALVPALLNIRGARLPRRLLRTVWGRHWPFAQWLALMLLLIFGQEQAIALGLGATLGDEAIGGLRAGQYLIGTTHFIWVALENFVPTSAARAHANGGIPALTALLQRTTLLFGALVWGVILLVSLPAELSLRLAFGPGYEHFAPILRIYALIYAIAFSREVWVFFFYATERTAVIFRAFSAGFVVAAIVFVPAIQNFGILGAALTVLAANVTSTAYVLASVWLVTRSARREADTSRAAPVGARLGSAVDSA
ncbi:MAG: hypothetical protein R3D68_14010 [Hyphomicrobiaceae bacterium]